MKWFYLVGLLSLVSGVCKANKKSVGGGDLEYYAIIENGLGRLCRADEGHKRIARAVENLRFCFDDDASDKIAEWRVVGGSVEDLCFVLQEVYGECWHDLLDGLGDCFRPEEKYLPDFLYDVCESTNKYLCAEGAAGLFKLFTPGSVDCAKEEFPSLVACVTNALNRNPIDVYRKSEVCEQLSMIGSCVEDHVKEQCANDPNLIKTVAGVTKAFRSPCNH